MISLCILIPLRLANNNRLTIIFLVSLLHSSTGYFTEAHETLLPVLGKLRFLGDRSRPDLQFILSYLGSHALNPTEIEKNYVDHLLGYLNNTREIGKLVGGRDREIILFGFSDASYTCDGNALSQLGRCFFITKDSACISAGSKKDSTVSHSSCESEIKAIDAAVREAVYLRSLLKELAYEQKKPTRIYVDSASAIEIFNILKTSHAVKHINVRIHYIRECINQREVSLVFIPSKYNVADVLTKPLVGGLFDAHASRLMYGFANDSVCPNTVEVASMCTCCTYIDTDGCYEDDTYEHC